VLSADSLAERIVSELINQGLAETSSGLLEKWAKAIAQAVVDEIQQNSELQGTDSMGGSITGKVV